MRIKDLIKETAELSENDKKRLMQCVKCMNNPETCNCTEADEDENGMCKRYKKSAIWG